MSLVTLTESAKKYLEEVGKPNVFLGVDGGGCSGFTYKWDITDKKPTVDNLHVDPYAEMFIAGCTIDYVNELGGSYLKIVNPNATAQCGCGSSFGV
jgi:iron-sulfur cluster insertion protein